MAALATSGPGVTHEREDLANVIYRIDPAEVPFLSNMRKGTASAIRHDWTVQELVAPNDANAVAENHDATFEDLKIPDRFDNFTQIHEKDGQVSGTYDAVNTAGNQRETARQKILKGLELRRDLNKSLSNNTPKAGPGGIRRLAGAGTGITNVSVGATGAAPTGDGSDAATPGTARAFDTSAYIDTVMQAAYEEGGQPRAMYMTPGIKRKFSELPDAWAPGTAHRVNATAPAEITFVGAADAYVSDFGTLQVVVDRFLYFVSATSHIIYLIDPRYIECCNLPGRNFVTTNLGKTGDSTKFQIIFEGTEEVSAPKAHGAIWALDPAL